MRVRNVSPVRFSTLNLVSAFAWSFILLTLVSHVGPRVLQYAGIHGIWGAIVPGALLILFVLWLSHDLNPSSRIPDQ